MIAYIKGKVIHFSNGVVILENNQIGYEIFCSAESYAKLVANKEGGVFTYMAVRDDGISLFGFDSLAEKSMFLKLISVSGVGPKLAMTVLSAMSLNDLAFLIASSDVKALSSIKGVGKKTSERLILELREAISGIDVDVKTSVAISKYEDNAVMALMSLGYTRQESTKAVKLAIDSGISGLEKIITHALQNGF